MLLEKLKQITELLTHLDESGLISGYALIGGLAVSTWSTPRATVDVDLLLLADIENLHSFVVELKKHGLDVELFKGGFDDPVPYLIRAAHLDILVATKALEAESVRQAITVDIGQALIPVVPVEYLLLLKLRAGGPKDLMDARALYLSDHLDNELLHALAEQFHCTKLLQKLLKDAP